jgi:acetyltransferase-like isoleucine patch superfamily enzyme
MIPRRFTRLSVLRSLWASLRHRRRVLVGRGSVFRVRGRLDMEPGSVLTVGLLHGQAGARVEINGTLKVSGRVQVMRGCRVMVRKPGTLEFGDRSYLNDNCTVVVYQLVSIGSGCAIAWGVTIVDHDGHRLIRDDDKAEGAVPVLIGDRCWIGANSTVLKGVSLTYGVVVAAGSVVVHSAEPWSLVAGVPARVVDKQVEWVR